MRTLRGFPWYPTLIALARPLVMFAGGPVPLETGARIFVGAALVGIVTTAVWVRLLGRDRGAAAAAFTILGLLIAVDPARVLLLTAAIGLLLVEAAWSARGTMRIKVPWSRVTSVLTTLLVVFAVVQLGRIVYVRLPWTPPAALEAGTIAPGATLPDIFVVVADGRGRSDVLRDRYGYDDEHFRQSMAAAGLTESDRAWANHSTTRFSLAVLLNGRPLSDLGQDLALPPDGTISYRATEASSGIDLLRRAGYLTTVISSGYDHVPLRNVDRYVDVGPRSEAEQALMRSTAVGLLIDELTNLWVAGGHERVLGEYRELVSAAMAPSSQPLFVLAHVPAPHMPVVFNADCSVRHQDAYTAGSIARDERAGDEVAVRVMADQTRCTDTLLAAAVRDVVEARPGAVVVVLSDHGPEERLDWWRPQEPAIHDRMAITFWSRTPGHPDLFPDDSTLVNLFPVLANAYLGTELPVHPNDLYFGPTPSSTMFTPYRP